MLALRQLTHKRLPLINAMRRDKHIIIARHHKSKQDKEEDDMRDNEARDHERVVAQRVELGICEGEDDGQHGGAYVSQDYGPEDGDAPIVSAANDAVEVAPDLVSLGLLETADRTVG